MRIISIGRNQPLLDRLTAALQAAGHDAVSTTSFDDPLVNESYDVVGFGRAVTPDIRERLERELRAHNPEIASYQGMCPEVGVLVGQVEYELAQRDTSVVSGFALVGDVVSFEVHREVELTWRIRHVNLLMRGSDRVLGRGTYGVGQRSARIRRPSRGKNFLQVGTWKTVFIDQL